MERVGTCSICGGDVVGVRGVWHSTSTPPPDTCKKCGAVAQCDIIKMYPRPGTVHHWNTERERQPKVK